MTPIRGQGVEIATKTFKGFFSTLWPTLTIFVGIHTKSSPRLCEKTMEDVWTAEVADRNYKVRPDVFELGPFQKKFPSTIASLEGPTPENP